MNFIFTTENSIKQADEIIEYLQGPRLWIARSEYPDFDKWLNKTHLELKNETKRALISISDKKIIAAIIYQKHKIEKDTLEIKNISVSPKQEGRYIANFMLRNAEIEGRHDFNVNKILIDSKSNNTAIRKFLLRNNYIIYQNTDLYKLGSGEDIIYSKELI